MTGEDLYGLWTAKLREQWSDDSAYASEYASIFRRSTNQPATQPVTWAFLTDVERQAWNALATEVTPLPVTERVERGHAGTPVVALAGDELAFECGESFYPPILGDAASRVARWVEQVVGPPAFESKARDGTRVTVGESSEDTLDQLEARSERMPSAAPEPTRPEFLSFEADVATDSIR